MRVDVICNDGSPLGVVLADVYGENGRLGVGGAELALLTLCEAWHNSGHRVRLYNSPSSPSRSPFEQYPIDTFIPAENRDILIIFRSPNFRSFNAKGKKIWWSCDQYTVGDFRAFSTKVDKIVTISPFHARHFQSTYGIDVTTTIDLPVRISDYSEVTKVENRLIFCSVPDRGLSVLARVYPLVKEHIPSLSLSITSDYRLWGVPEARNEGYIRQFFGMDGVKFLGAIPRREMVKEQLQAQVQAYPNVYDELFCYAVAECSVAGALPITTSKGALETTNMGIQVAGDAHNPNWAKNYADVIIETINNKSLLAEKQNEIREKARTRFSLETILPQWEKVFNE